MAKRQNPDAHGKGSKRKAAKPTVAERNSAGNS